MLIIAEEDSMSNIITSENGSANCTQYTMKPMTVMEKLTILTDAAKYDAACTSSGSDRSNTKGGIGKTVAGGICHSFSSDGRCISLLKILQTNDCIFDCKYCANRKSNDIPRAVFEPDEIADLTINFYKRNYIEGLFLSSAIIKNPTYTMQLLHDTIKILREKYCFNGYIHVKAIPGADAELIERTGYLVDRMSVNIEMPSEESLRHLAPNKTKDSILKPMKYISNRITENKNEIVVYKKSPKFVPGGQGTQMIIGASPDTDNKIIHLSEGLYNKYRLKRVFYSAFVRVNDDSNLPIVAGGPPLLREHRLYQADWLLRFYNFKADELLDENNPNFNTLLDPKCDWAVRHMERFPVEVNKAELNDLLRVPGIGVTSAKRIVIARRAAKLDFEALKRLGVVLKRAQFFITCSGKMINRMKLDDRFVLGNLIRQRGMLPKELCAQEIKVSQLSLFDAADLGKIDTGSDIGVVNNVTHLSLPNAEDSMMSLTGNI